MFEKNKNYNVNCVFLGESGCGKTSIIKGLVGENFEENTESTVAPNYYFVQNIKFLNEEEENSEISIDIWDTAGQEKFRSVGKVYIQRADIIIFVRDNLKENFDNWFKFVENLIDIETRKVIYCLNKTDLMSEKEKLNIFNELQKKNREKKHHATIQCVSCKNSDGILNLKSLIEEKSQEIITMELQKHKYNINIILIGPQSVGKSSLIERIINDTFEMVTKPTLYYDVKLVKVNLKDHSSINYRYFDVCGQENFISTWIHLLDKVDIIIFVNDKENLEVNTSIIKGRVLLNDKKVICCINKKDLFSDGENDKTLKIFKKINYELGDIPIILVSAKISDGIKELKSQINEYSLNIIKKKNSEIQESEKLNRINIKLDPERKDKKRCC